MLRHKTENRPAVWSPCTTSDQETERVNSYNPGARMGLRQALEIRKSSPFRYAPLRILSCAHINYTKDTQSYKF